MDLSKLTPLPLEVRTEATCLGEIVGFNLMGSDRHDQYVGTFGRWRKDDAAFHVLARRAFDVIVRRRTWAPCEYQGGWTVEGLLGGEMRPLRMWRLKVGAFPDPFTALVEADAWFAANIEAAPKS